MIDIANDLGIKESTLSAWVRDPDCQKIYREEIGTYGYRAYARAIHELEKQLDDPSPWVRQGAAREIIARYHDGVTGQDSREIIIKLQGAPEIGLPAAATDDATNYIDAEEVVIS